MRCCLSIQTSNSADFHSGFMAANFPMPTITGMEMGSNVRAGVEAPGALVEAEGGFVHVTALADFRDAA
jgi:hypothetical protein